MARRRPRPPRRVARLSHLALAASLLPPPLAALGVLGAFAPAPAAAQVTLLTNRGYVSGTTVDWQVLGDPFTPVPGSFTLTLPGNTVDVTNATDTDMERRDQLPCDFWDG